MAEMSSRDGREGDRAALVHFHVQLVAYVKVGQLHERRVKNNALRVADLRDELDHGVILSFTASVGNNSDGQSNRPCTPRRPRAGPLPYESGIFTPSAFAIRSKSSALISKRPRRKMKPQRRLS